MAEGWRKDGDWYGEWVQLSDVKVGSQTQGRGNSLPLSGTERKAASLQFLEIRYGHTFLLRKVENR
jgi:hypothetical protein